MSSSVVSLRRAIARGACFERMCAWAMIVASALFLLALPLNAEALVVRQGTTLTVSADEVIDDTLIVLGQTLIVEGTINGDLVALARRVTVRGQVNGDLLSAAQAVDVQGAVTGNVIAFGRSVDFNEARVANNVYAFGENVSVGRGSEITHNAVTFGNVVNFGGAAGTDLLSFARDLNLSGSIGRHVEARGASVTLYRTAAIGGDLTAYVEEGGLHRAPDASVGGSVETPVTERPPPRNRYLTVSFYIGQVVRLGIAFLAGLVLLWLLPDWRAIPLSGSRALPAAGIGLATAVALPIVSVILAVTIIGLPLALLGLALWGLGLYYGKIVLAQQIGRRLFEAPHGTPHYAATLLTGLVIVIIVINVPFLGRLANIVLTLLGLGLIVMHLFSYSERGRRLMETGADNAAAGRDA